MTERYELRRRDVQRERALLDGLRGFELGQARKNARWAEIDEALELCLSPAAAKLARAQADADHQAQDALQRADQLDPALVSEVRRIRSTPRESPAPVAPGDPAVLQQVRVALAEHRASGLGFAEAWEGTVGRIQPDKGAVGVWLQALRATRPHWEKAYERHDDQAAEQVASLLEGLDALDDDCPQMAAA